MYRNKGVIPQAQLGYGENQSKTKEEQSKTKEIVLSSLKTSAVENPKYKSSKSTSYLQNISPSDNIPLRFGNWIKLRYEDALKLQDKEEMKRMEALAGFIKTGDRKFLIGFENDQIIGYIFLLEAKEKADEIIDEDKRKSAIAELDNLAEKNKIVAPAVLDITVKYGFYGSFVAGLEEDLIGLAKAVEAARRQRIISQARSEGMRYSTDKGSDAQARQFYEGKERRELEIMVVRN